MSSPASLAKLKVPLTAQEVELFELVYDAGAMRQLRVRIRERVRFTTLDLDPVTANRLGELLCRFARAQRQDAVGLFDGARADRCPDPCDG